MATRNGFLFIGDPHMDLRTPGKRMDARFHEVVADKLGQAAKIARHLKLIPVCLGDLFNRATISKNDIHAYNPMLVHTIRALLRFDQPLLTLDANHDKRESEASEKDCISVLREAGLVELIDNPEFFRVFELPGRKVALCATPYGHPIPDREVQRTPEIDFLIRITHADIAFDGAYPNSIEAFEISGCDMVVNGHIHGTKRPLQKGTTTWFNPGNITRLSIDMVDHIPCVWSYRPDYEGTDEWPAGIERHPLSYQKKVFDLAGKMVNAEAEEQGDAEMPALSSLFVDLFRDDAALDEAADSREGVERIMSQALEQAAISHEAKILVGQVIERAFAGD